MVPEKQIQKVGSSLGVQPCPGLGQEAVPLSCALPKVTLPNYDNVPGNLMLSALGLRLGDRVLLDGQKVRNWSREGRAGLSAQSWGLGQSPDSSPLSVNPPGHAQSVYFIQQLFC